MAGILAPLDRKVLRDLWRTRGQALAIALVVGCGIALYVMSNGMVRSLEETRLAYYERYRFADIFASAVRVPEAVVEDIGELPGVLSAEGRIAGSVLIDVPGVAEPIRGQVVSLPDHGTALLNRVFLRQGRMIEPLRDDDILLSEKFAQAHGLAPGDRISATLYGAKRSFRISGLALSPEFIYTISPGEFVPDDARFGVIWMGKRALEGAFDLDGAVNDILVDIGPGANPQAVIDAMDARLKRYGATGAFTRDDQISHRFVSSELDQLRTMGRILPPIFLGVAAFLLNIVVGRMIDLEREQIGLLKAFGYSSRAIIGHYARYVMTMALAGGVMGCAAGIWLGRGLAGLYSYFLNLPFLIFRTDPQVIAIGLAVAIGAAALGIAFAVRRLIRLNPAVAMRPPIPLDYSHALREPAWMKRSVDQPSRMILRRIIRQPFRALLTLLGVAAATGLLVVGRFNIDAVTYMMDVNFTVADRQDLTVTFTEPRAGRTIHELTSLDGVLAAEPFRAVPVRISHGAAVERQSITGLIPDSRLSRPIDSDLRQIPLPENGLLVSISLAEELDVSIGDVVSLEVLEGRQPVLTVPVAGIAESFVGAPAYMRLDRLNEALDEGPRISGVYLETDKAKLDALYGRIKDMPQVVGVAVHDALRRSFEQLMSETTGTTNAINALFAALIAIGVVYNSARVALSERARELASLRVLGFSRAETSYVLLGEMALLTVLAVPLGLAFGSGLAWYLVQSFSSDLYRIPMVISPATYGYAVSVILGASLATGILVNRDVRRLDLIRALKTRE